MVDMANHISAKKRSRQNKVRNIVIDIKKFLFSIKLILLSLINIDRKIGIKGRTTIK